MWLFTTWLLYVSVFATDEDYCVVADRYDWVGAPVRRQILVSSSC